MIEVKFYDEAEDKKLKYAVIAASCNGKWVFCKHKERSTYEIPGGHRELGETILEAAKRELYEETGAVEFDITPICVYKIDDYGMLFYADIHKFGELPDFEMERIYYFDDLPDDLTYPFIQPALFEKCAQWKRDNMKITLKRANVSDAEKIHKMQTEAFAGLLERYKDFDTSPANEPLEKTVRRLNDPFTYFYFILKDGTVIGAIRVVDKGDNTAKRISPLFIMPEYRNKGFAQAAIIEAEKIHGKNNWELDTILQEKGNCYLYEKMGYRRTGAVKKINDIMTLVYYEK